MKTPKTDREWALYWVAKFTELVRSGKTWWQAPLDRAKAELRDLSS